MKYVIGLDLGSGSIRAGVFDLAGHPVAMASRPSVSVAPDSDNPGHIVWPHRALWKSVSEVLREVHAALPHNAEIAGIAAACLGMDGLPLDKDGNELYDFIAWTDSRCTPLYEAWLRDFGEEQQFLATGTPPRSFSTLFRMQWMARHHPEIAERAHKWVLMGDYINFRLCGALAIDHSMAACTLLFDPATRDWSSHVAGAAGVDVRLMCDLQQSGSIIGTVGREAARDTSIPEGTPVILGGHDYLCGAIPVGGHQPGTVVNIGGTWDIVQSAVPQFAPSAEIAGTGWTIEPHVAPSSHSVFGAAIGGAVTSWFRNEFLSDLSDEAYFNLASEVANCRPGQVMFLPHLAGATGPVVDHKASGAFFGVRAEHSRSDLLCAVFEGLNIQTSEILQSISLFGVEPDRLSFVGGSSKNSALVQAKANVLQLPVEVPEFSETTSLGAAMLAAYGAGSAGSFEDTVEAMKPGTAVIEPESQLAALMEDRKCIYRQGFEALKKIQAPVSTV